MPTARNIQQAIIDFLGVMSAEETSNITTTSSTDVLATGMSITPPAGTYRVVFSTSVENSNAGGVLFVSIYAGGVQAAASEREIDAPGANESSDATSVAVVTVDGSQAIEGRWRRSAGTALMHGRILILNRVA